MILTPNEFERLKCFFYHTVSAEVAQGMAQARQHYLTLAVQVLREQPPSRAQSLSLTALEESLMRTIQGLALQGVVVLPEGWHVSTQEA